MIHVSRKLEYALMVLKFMAQGEEGQVFTARILCAKTRAPFDTISKVMQSMSNAMILKSNKGVNGGYVLNVDLNTINYTQLVSIIESSELDVRCSNERTPCSHLNGCVLSPSIRRLNTLTLNFFSSLSLANILDLPSEKALS